jgi:hypothetical protein
MVNNRGLKASSLVFVFYFLWLHSYAQSVSVSLDRDKILLGEQATLQFNLDHVNESELFVATWPQPKDTLNHTEILKNTAIDTINVNGYNSYRQNFTLTSFDSGYWQLGPFVFVLQDKITGKQTRLRTDAAYLAVLPVDVSSMKDYNPLKDIIDVETSFNWLPVFIAVAVLLLAIVAFIIMKKRRKRPAEVPKAILKGTPLERAMKKLQALQNEKLSSPEAIKNFHSEIDIITRQYLEEMTFVKALQLTASELFTRINTYMQDAQLRKIFREIFELNVSVKFAKYMPAAEESRHTLKEIIKILNQIDDSINHARINAERMVPKY